jgi:hypothetical protein
VYCPTTEKWHGVNVSMPDEWTSELYRFEDGFILDARGRTDGEVWMKMQFRLALEHDDFGSRLRRGKNRIVVLWSCGESMVAIR